MDEVVKNHSVEQQVIDGAQGCARVHAAIRLLHFRCFSGCFYFFHLKSTFCAGACRYFFQAGDDLPTHHCLRHFSHSATAWFASNTMV
ncbi:MAG: hypothetical protein CMF51_05650 [Legionellales bacterium]|nr:hypothetical protein [Legionellales bacterium]